MNFLSMKYFVMVAREKSFTKAADQLHITQQTLSAHISSVEQELGCPLLIRHVPLKLTYAGQVFLSYAIDFQKRYDSLFQEFSDITSSEKGVLRIGIAPTRGTFIMPDLIVEFQKRYPGIEVHLSESTNDVLSQKLTKGEIDLAIANFPDKLPGIELQDFYEEEVVLLISNQLLNEIYGEKAKEILNTIEQQQSIAPLAECPFLLNRQEDIAGRIGRYFIAKADFSPMVKAQANNVETLLALCTRGTGACFSPEILAKAALSQEEQKKIQVIRFREGTQYQIKFGWVKQPYCWSMISNFIQTATAALKKHH